MKILKSALYAIIIAVPLLYYSCNSGLNIFTKSDDVQLGQQVQADMKSKPGEYPVFHGDPSIKSYITSNIFDQVLASPQIENKNVFPYQVEILDQDILNAFTLPGGFIYIYTGLLNYLDSEAALAGVLGHEIAHAELRHATQRMTSYYGVSILLSMILGENPSQIAEIGANLFVGLAFLANSRSDENQADEYSYKYLKDTRFYPGSVKFFFEKMRADGLISSNSNKVATFLSTHPDPIDRIASTNQRLQNDGRQILDYTATGPGIFKEEYQLNIKSKLGGK